MTTYINVNTMEYPMHEGDIRLLHPEIGDEFVCPEEFALLHNSPFPEFDPEVKKFENGTPENIDGVWYRTWVLKDMTAEEIVKRKESILKTIEEQGQLSPELKSKIEKSFDLQEIEDLYLPYKKNKKTRADVARENGLEPLAKLILAQKNDDVDF